MPDKPEIILTLPEYEKLLHDQQKLRALEAAGVDNWEGYEYALDIFESRRKTKPPYDV